PPGIYTLSLHDALPICAQGRDRALEARRPAGRRADPARAAACARRARGFVMRWLLALFLALAPCLAFAQAAQDPAPLQFDDRAEDRKSTRLNSSHVKIS